MRLQRLTPPTKMEFDPRWLLFVLPVAFVLGWLASKLDSKQWKLEQRESPKAYFKGLNLLLNEQQDKAIDAFIEAVQHDPDTSDLHFALGNLFRRRGEYERAMDEAMSLADWKGFPARKAQARSRGKLAGIGLANYIEITMGAPRERAEIVVDGLPKKSPNALRVLALAIT